MKPCPGLENEWHHHPNGGGWVKNTATVPEKVFVGPDAVIWGGTFRGGTFLGGTFRGGTVLGGTWNHQPLTIYGSRHPVINAKPGHIMVGCRCEPFAWWTTLEAKQFAIDHGYNEAEQEEYRKHVKHVTEVGR